MEACNDEGGLFRTSFLDQGLVTFAECVEHYQALGSESLLDEMRLLLTAPMLAIPFGVSSARYYALMSALVRCAGTDRGLSDARRKKLVRICTDIGTYLRGRAADKRAEAFETALAAALGKVRGSNAFPEIADQIAAGLRTDGDADALRAEPVPAVVDGLQVLQFDEPPLPFRLAASA